MDKSIDIQISGTEESLEIDPHTYAPLDFEKGSKVIIWESKVVFYKWCGN